MTTLKYKTQPQHQDWNSWNTISPGEARVYKGTWGERMIRHLTAEGYTMPHIAGIWSAKPKGITYQDFIQINWVESK
jgi:hypothetical protein